MNPDIASNPLAQRIMEVLDVDHGGDIDFNEFTAGLSIFSASASKEKKLRCNQYLSLFIHAFF